MMPLFNQDQFTQLVKNGEMSNGDKDHYPVVKLFTPDTQAAWLLTDIDPHDHDRTFALCDTGSGFPELGYLSLSRLIHVRKQMGHAIEQDLNFHGKFPISIYAKAARLYGNIIEDEQTLSNLAGQTAERFSVQKTNLIKGSRKQSLKEFFEERNNYLNDQRHGIRIISLRYLSPN